MKVRFLTPANRELRDAFAYYDHELPGLGKRFLGEIDSALQRIQLAPMAWTPVGRITRRCLLKSFPYSVLYVPDAQGIVVVAIAHQRRDPARYQDRID